MSRKIICDIFSNTNISYVILIKIIEDFLFNIINNYLIVLKNEKNKGTIGIEPMTSWSAVKCSTTELSTQVIFYNRIYIFIIIINY